MGRYYEEIHLTLPDDIEERFHHHMEPDEIHKKYPGKILLSWSTEMSRIWNFLAKCLECDNLPPPLCIDRRKNPPMNITQEDSEEFISYIIGLTNTNCSIYNDYMSPVDYEVRIFEKNFIRDLEALFGEKMHAPYLLVKMHMWHILIHECFHFKTIIDKYTAMLHGKDENALEFQDAIVNLGGILDETYTEACALNAMSIYYLEGMSAEASVKMITKSNPWTRSDLRIVMNGNYDKWMRKRYDYYKAASLYMTLTSTAWKTTFADQFSKDMYRAVPCVYPDEHERQKMFKAFHEVCEELWKSEEKPKFAFVD